MNYPRLVIASLLLLCSQFTFASSIQTYWITNVTMGLIPNDGAGDPLYFDFRGPHFEFYGFGTMDCIQCNADQMYDYPSFTAIQAHVDFVAYFVIDGVTYPSDAVTFTSSLFADHDGGINPLVTGVLVKDGTSVEFTLKLPTNGIWNADFGYSAPDGNNPGYYYFTDAAFSANQAVPEPGTIALTITGLAGIAGLVRKKSLRP
jgi:hypothetical protein